MEHIRVDRTDYLYEYKKFNGTYNIIIVYSEDDNEEVDSILASAGDVESYRDIAIALVEEI